VTSTAPPAPPLDRAARQQRILDQHEQLLTDHAAEVRSPAWAAKQERNVEAKLTALSETTDGAFKFRSVDCRTSTCVAKLEWPTREVAKGNVKSLLTGAPDLPCAREIAFPPSGAEGPYTASLYLDCREPGSRSANERQ
jgi:hypothetical protein